VFLNVLFFYAFIVMQLIQSCKEFHLPTIRLGHVTRKTVSEMTYNVSMQWDVKLYYTTPYLQFGYSTESIFPDVESAAFLEQLT